MEIKENGARPASAGAQQFNQQRQPVSAGEPAEIDYLPKKMTPLETIIASLKLA